MSFLKSVLLGKHNASADSPTKRISTPAGDRLSTILENAQDHSRSRSSRRSFSKLVTPMEGGKKSFDRSPSTTPYSLPSIWSEASLATSEKLEPSGPKKYLARRGGWKRLVLLIALAILVIVGVVVGVVVGLRQKNQNSDGAVSSESPESPESSESSESSDSNPSRSPPDSDETENFIPVSPSTDDEPGPDFPRGTYSVVTFLDTVQSNCTSNPLTWSCFPYTDYNTSPLEALTVFNWKIEQSSDSKDKFTVSSSLNPLSIAFDNTPLKLVNAGEDGEHYRLQVTLDREVRATGPLTPDNSAATCFFNATTLQAYLYTRRARSYPEPEYDIGTDAAFPQWPYAVRVEQVISGGPDVPSCFRVEDGAIGERITEGLEPTEQGAASLCSCLYKNWRTPDPNRFD